MKTFALLVCCLTLTFATIGCKKEETKPAVTPPAAGASDAAPAGDADKDGDANATDAAPADAAAH